MNTQKVQEQEAQLHGLVDADHLPENVHRLLPYVVSTALHEDYYHRLVYGPREDFLTVDLLRVDLAAIDAAECPFNDQDKEILSITNLVQVRRDEKNPRHLHDLYSWDVIYSHGSISNCFVTRALKDHESRRHYSVLNILEKSETKEDEEEEEEEEAKLQEKKELDAQNENDDPRVKRPCQ
jgi:hypothetical protein